MVKLTSPTGVKLTTNEKMAETLLRRGYKLVEEPAPVVAAPRRTRKKNPAPKEA